MWDVIILDALNYCRLPTRSFFFTKNVSRCNNKLSELYWVSGAGFWSGSNGAIIENKSVDRALGVLTAIYRGHFGNDRRADYNSGSLEV